MGLRQTRSAEWLEGACSILHARVCAPLEPDCPPPTAPGDAVEHVQFMMKLSKLSCKTAPATRVHWSGAAQIKSAHLARHVGHRQVRLPVTSQSQFVKAGVSEHCNEGTAIICNNVAWFWTVVDTPRLEGWSHAYNLSASRQRKMTQQSLPKTLTEAQIDCGTCM